MFFRILKRDLKRKKTMNIILLLFVILAAVFVASGVNNVLTVANGVGYFMDKAGVGDVAMLAFVREGGTTIEDVYSQNPAVGDIRVEDVILCDYTAIRINGEKADPCNACLLESVEDAQFHFFDQKNQEITSVPEGHIRISGKFKLDNALTPGDKIQITLGGAEREFIYDGIAKDALLGSDFMGNSRFLINSADLELFFGDETVQANYRAQVGNVDTEDLGGVTASTAQVSNLIVYFTKSTIKLVYMMDLIVAFMVLLLSVCLMIVAFVVLKFMINFTIAEEFREIGVMKAIGIRNFKIRSLYIVKYMMMAVAGSVIGFFLSIPVGRKLMNASAKNMVLGNDAGILPNLAGSIIVILFIILLSYLCTKKVKKLTPIDAVRVGQTGERYKKKTPYRIGKSHLGTCLYLAVNDVLSNLKRYITITVSFLLCTLFVLLLVNTTATMRSPKLAGIFGAVSDLYYMEADAARMAFTGEITREEAGEFLKKREKEFRDAGMPSKVFVSTQYSYNLTFSGKEYKLYFEQGIGVKTDAFEYLEGSAPQNAKEIAITPQISEMTGAKIGDTVTIDFGEEKIDCIVTAYFQTMNQVGQLIRLHEDAPTDFSHISNIGNYQVCFTDQPGEAEIIARKERIAEIAGVKEKDIRTAAEFCAEAVEVVETLELAQYLLLLITLVVVLLVTILMERSFIADEKTQIAILKAIGFKDGSVILWHVCRFGLVALVSVLFAGVLSIPVTKLAITPVFGMMGAVGIDYQFDPLKIFVIYPGIVFLMTLLVAWVTALYTKTIKSRDTASIE